MAMWSPWRGCHRCSEGCRYCYIHKGDAKRGVDTDSIVCSEKLDAPIARKKNGEYKMAGGQIVYLCFQTDFLIEEADVWNIVYETIMGYDEKKLEILTREVANRELRGVTLWGGVIGAVVGLSMSVVMWLIG